MRLATFNVENLFRRPAVMSLDTWADGREVLDDVARLNSLLAKPQYSGSDKQQVKTILDKYEFGKPNKRDRPFGVNEVREKLYKVPKGSQKVEIVADGRGSWVGWVELAQKDIDPRATHFAGRVIHEVGADIVCTVEVEDRLTLARFNSQVLGADFQVAYRYNLCIDGNDPRGIDVGLLSRHPITSVRSHIHDEDAEGVIFSRDCAEYEIALPKGKTLWVLANHFKSKGYGGAAASNAKRERQARRVAEVYREALGRSQFVAVVGDLNDTPTSAPLRPLVQQTDLKDVSTHPLWTGDIGTYGTGRAKGSKIDYLLLSPALWTHVSAVGVERRGIFAPSVGIMWPGITKQTAASDHAALWVEVSV